MKNIRVVFAFLILVALVREAGAYSADLRVGVISSQDGSVIQSRATNDGGQVTQAAHGDYQEATKRGNVFTATAKTITVLATCDIAPLPAGGCPILGLYNPPGSKVNLSLLYAGCDTVSGTPGGPLYLDGINAQNAITQVSSSNTVVNMQTLALGGSVGRAYSQGSITGSALANTLRPLCGPAAIAAGAGNYSCDQELKGSINVPPSGLVGITAHAVGTTHVLSCYITWEEVPL